MNPFEAADTGNGEVNPFDALGVPMQQHAMQPNPFAWQQQDPSPFQQQHSSAFQQQHYQLTQQQQQPAQHQQAYQHFATAQQPPAYQPQQQLRQQQVALSPPAPWPAVGLSSPPHQHYTAHPPAQVPPSGDFNPFDDMFAASGASAAEPMQLQPPQQQRQSLSEWSASSTAPFRQQQQQQQQPGFTYSAQQQPFPQQQQQQQHTWKGTGTSRSSSISTATTAAAYDPWTLPAPPPPSRSARPSLPGGTSGMSMASLTTASMTERRASAAPAAPPSRRGLAGSKSMSAAAWNGALGGGGSGGARLSGGSGGDDFDGAGSDLSEDDFDDNADGGGDGGGVFELQRRASARGSGDGGGGGGGARGNDVYHADFAKAEKKLGMLLERKDEWVPGSEQRRERAVVSLVVDMGPAQGHGVTVGSKVLAVNGASVEGMTYAEVLQAIKAAPRPMRVTFARGGGGEEANVGRCLYKTCAGAPRSYKVWKRRYFVIGGAVARPNVLQLYNSKQAFDHVVIAVFQRAPVTQRVKAVKLGSAWWTSPIRAKQYDGAPPLHTFFVKKSGWHFKQMNFASESLPELERLREQILRVCRPAT